MKTCRTCKQSLDESEFNKDKSRKDGLQNQCKSCRVSYNKKYIEKNKESVRAYRKEYYNKNKNSLLEYCKNWRRTNAGKESDRRHSSKRRGFGYEPINERFEGSEFHHLHIDEDHNIGIYLPKDIHQSIYHNSFTGEGMLAINIIALLYLSKH